MTTDALTRKSTVRELVAAFQEAEREVRTCFARLQAAENKLNDAYLITGYSRIRICAAGFTGRYYDDFNKPDHAIEMMARGAWSYIVARCDVRRMMSIARVKQLDQQLDKGELPPITEENVTAFIEGFLGNLQEMLEEAVCEVFEWLRPRHSAYKTNSELEIGRKVVLGYIVQQRDRRWSPGPTFRLEYSKSQHLVALENVFNALDGKGQIIKGHVSDLEAAINACPREIGHGKTSMFEFRVFDNGNMHLTFLRLDLLKLFNQIAGGRRLRPAQESAA